MPSFNSLLYIIEGGVFQRNRRNGELMELPAREILQQSSIELFQLTDDLVTDSYVRWVNDPRVNRFLVNRFNTHNKETIREFVRDCVTCPNTLLLGIRSLELGGCHVGNIKLGLIDHHHGLGDVGIMLGEPGSWGRGIGSEAIRLICDIADRNLGLRKITSGCFASNVYSQKAFRRAGFEVEGLRRAHFICDGQPEDLVLMARWLR